MWLSNLQVKVLMSCLLLNKTYPDYYENRLPTCISHLYFLLWLPGSSLSETDPHCLHTLSQTCLTLPLRSTPGPKAESKGVTCRALPGEGHLHHQPQQQRLQPRSCPSITQATIRSQCQMRVKKPMHSVRTISLYRSAYRGETFQSTMEDHFLCAPQQKQSLEFTDI